MKGLEALLRNYPRERILRKEYTYFRYAFGKLKTYFYPPSWVSGIEKQSKEHRSVFHWTAAVLILSDSSSFSWKPMSLAT